MKGSDQGDSDSRLVQLWWARRRENALADVMGSGASDGEHLTERDLSRGGRELYHVGSG
jgi:hypothetical protein